MDYVLTIASLIGVMIILAGSYNLVLGYTGMVHVGHVGFMAIGAYSSALLTGAGFPFWFGLLAGIFFAGLAGFILGLPTVRFREDYLVAATLGMGEIIRLILLNERTLTGGSTGLPRIISPSLFGFVFDTRPLLFLFVAAVTVFAMGFIWMMVRAPFGRVLEGILEDEIATKTLGKNTSGRKLQVLVIASLLAGLSGVLYAHVLQFIDPETFNIHLMIYIFLMVVFGGAGKFWGPMVGATILYIVFEIFRHIGIPPHIYGPLRWMLFSFILVAMIILKPKGILGEKLVRKKF